MYRTENAIEIQYNKTYKRACFKCTLRTAMCIQLSPNDACIYAFKVGYNEVQFRLKQINPYYTLIVVSTKYNRSKKYKYNGVQVTEYSITSYFKIACNGKLYGDYMTEAILAELIKVGTNIKIKS